MEKRWENINIAQRRGSNKIGNSWKAFQNDDRCRKTMIHFLFIYVYHKQLTTGLKGFRKLQTTSSLEVSINKMIMAQWQKKP